MLWPSNFESWRTQSLEQEEFCEQAGNVAFTKAKFLLYSPRRVVRCLGKYIVQMYRDIIHKTGLNWTYYNPNYFNGLRSPQALLHHPFIWYTMKAQTCFQVVLKEFFRCFIVDISILSACPRDETQKS